MNGYPTDEPCKVCGEVNGNQAEPRFYYVVCVEHQHLTGIEIDRLRQARLLREASNGKVQD